MQERVGLFGESSVKSIVGRELSNNRAAGQGRMRVMDKVRVLIADDHAQCERD